MHARNPHRDGIDFARLVKDSPRLARFVSKTKAGRDSIDFGNPQAQRALTAAILKSHYGVSRWELPEGHLSPSIPGRADHLHTAADLLAEENGGAVPTGKGIRVLDLGVGANCVYPLLGHAAFGWSFVGSEIDADALAAARKIVDSNANFRGSIELRLQSEGKILHGLFVKRELFDLTLCNPPFHASREEAQAGARRKWKNLGKPAPAEPEPPLNFGGRSGELWTKGGEVGFIRQLVEESRVFAKRCFWFTALVSKAESLPAIQAALQKASPSESKTLEMKQGQKTSRLLAWTYLNRIERAAWKVHRFR